jgi:mono/diheme cytochrome c family protein
MLCIARALITGLLLSALPAFAGNWNVPTTAKDILNPITWNKDAATEAGKIYTDHCVACHGMHGAGDGPKEKVEYDLRTILDPLTDGELYWKITHGVGKMPSYAGVLTDNERWLMVLQLRHLPKLAR